MKLQSLLYGALVGAVGSSPVASPEAEAAAACPAAVSTGDLTPYAVVPISQSYPTTAYGSRTTSYVGSNDVCTWFAFKTPADLPNSICVLSFIFPDSGSLGTGASYNISGPGNFQFDALFYQSGEAAVGAATTWNSQPTTNAPTSSIVSYNNKLSPGTVTAVSTGPCSRVGATSQLFVRMCSQDSNFVFSQSTASCPIGLYLLMFPKTAATTT